MATYSNLYLVKDSDVEPRRVYFVATRPDGIPDVLANVTLEEPDDDSRSPDGALRPGAHLLCFSVSANRYFKAYAKRSDWADDDAEKERYSPYPFTSIHTVGDELPDDVAARLRIASQKS